ncbi:MAG: DUF1631 domain-containing protein [Gammaproteobacteria bacterium]|nr:DUF1631 domain-containing protein [Gammaproteobacteria bacterium]
MEINRGGVERTIDRTVVKALRACGEEACGSFVDAFEILLKRLDGVLFRKAGKAETPVLLQLYLDTSQALWTSRRVMLREFRGALLHNFHQSLRRDISPELDFNREREHDYELSLLENSNLDEYLVLTQMATDISRCCHRELKIIEKRVGELMLDPGLSNYHSPYTPMAVSYAVGHACAKANFTGRVHDLVMELCATYLGDTFLPPFEELHDLLADPQRVVDALSRGRARPVVVVKEEVPAAPDAVEIRNALIELLQRLQSDLAQPQSPGSRLPIRSVRELPDHPKLVGLSQPELVSIDMVAAIFDHILENPDIPARFKTLLGKLQFPLLKAALLDGDFLSGGAHPARQLLAQAANAARTRGDDPALFDLLSTLVGRVLKEFVQDTELFGGLLLGIESSLKQPPAQTARAKLAESKARVADLRQQAEQEVAERIARLGEDDTFVRIFLEQTWLPYLTMVAIRSGQGDEWRLTLNTMDSLIWSLEPRDGQAEQQRLFAFIPELIKRLQTGMNQMRLPDAVRGEFLSELASRHLPSPPGARQSSTKNDLEPAPTRAGSEQRPVPAASSESVDVHREIARGLAVGTWIELPVTAGRPLYARLGWRDAHSGQLFFVDEEGLSVARYGIDDFAADLRKRRVRVLAPDDSVEQFGSGLRA